MTGVSGDAAGGHDATLGELFGGRYRLGALLGVGGSASVYEAIDTRAGPDQLELVAVKVLHPHLCATGAMRAAFLREAQRAAQLQHPNIVAVRGSGVHDAGGLPMAWIAFDLLAGPTLAEWVERAGPLTPRAAAAVTDGLLAALGAAHGFGLVHRDVTPRNVVLAGAETSPPGLLEPGMVRLLDFGLADVTGRTALGGDVLLADRGTGAASVVGNLAYVSPEQASGRPVTPAADLYQAGAVLHFLLTGSPPYPRDTPEQVLRARLSAPPPVPSALAPAARPLDRVVTRAMAREPADRFPDAAAFRAALVDAIAGGATSPAQSSRPAWAPTRVMATTLPTASATAQMRRNAEPDRNGSPVDGQGDPPADGGEWVVDEPRGRNPVVLGALATIAVAAAISVITATTPGTAARPTPVVASSTPSRSATPTHTPSPRRTPSPQTVRIPTLHGTLDDAEHALRAAGLALGDVARTASAEAGGTLLGQSPDAGALVPQGTTVNLVVASGSNRVPAVAGLTPAAAAATLESAGFIAASDRPDADPDAPVTGTEPVEGTVLRLGVTVTMRRDTDPPESPSPSPSATPSQP